MGTDLSRIGPILSFIHGHARGHMKRKILFIFFIHFFIFDFLNI